MTPQTLPYTGPTPDDLARIPQALTILPQWILWRGKDRVDTQTGDITGLDKTPIDPQTLHNASTRDPRTWGTLDQCLAALPLALEEWETADPSAYRGGGIGFVFTKNDPYGGIDFDHCVDPTTRTLTAFAQAQVDTFNSYTEITPSGTGLHILAQGSVPPGHNRKGTIELYDQGRFFTMTGWHLPNTPRPSKRASPRLTFSGVPCLRQRSGRPSGRWMSTA